MHQWLFLVRATKLFQFQAANCLSRRSVMCSFSAGSGAKVSPSPGGMSAVKSSIDAQDKFEILWRDLFSDPSQWWDNRAGKPNPRFPDFKHKQSGEALWLIDGRNPPWAVSQIATIAPGLSIFTVAEKLARYNKTGQFEKTLQLFEQTQKEGIIIDGYISVRVLNACAALQRLEKGTRIHHQMIEAGRELNLYESSSLVDMYAKCGSIDDAWRVFNKMPKRDVVCWNAMIQGLVKCDQGVRALELFHNMQQEGVQPNSVTFLGLLNACASTIELEEGKRIHKHIIWSGFECDEYVANALVDMYAKCGSLTDAWRVFSKMPSPDVIAWNALILGFVKCGQGLEALQLFKKMQLDRVEPDSVSFVGVLNACSSVAEIEEGRRVHEDIVRSGWECDVYVLSSLVDMYAKCGCIEDAWRVFNKMPKRDVVCWNALILGFLKCGQGLKALGLFEKMQLEGVKPNSATFVGVLNACAGVATLETGKLIHRHIIDHGLEFHLHVSASLVDMYAKFGSIEDAWRVFNKLPQRDVVCWNALILGVMKCEQGLKVLEVFEKMQLEGVKPNSCTFVGVLNACASVAALETGKLIHRQIIDNGLEFHLYVSTSLVDMYAKCGSIEDAWRVFNKMPKRDVVCWNALILGFLKCGQGLKALELFEQMQLDGVEPDPSTFVGVLSACASVAALETGKSIHKQILDRGLVFDLYMSTALVDMYAKCGSLEDAWRVFNYMPKRDVVCWNALILGLLKCGQGLKALELYEKLQLEGVKPNSLTFVAVLNACASVAALETGKRIHRQVVEIGLELDLYVSTSLVDMYAKCGSLNEAAKVFDKVPSRDVATWNVMIMGYAMHGCAKEAVAYFEMMFQSGSDMDDVTFICVLSACSHGGLVKEGTQYFDSMTSVYGVSPTLEHYTCMVDLLGRAGRLDDAEEMVMTMPFEPSAAMWMALLGACRIHGNVEMGERASRELLELDRTNAAGYVLLSNIYAGAGNYQS